MQDASTKNWKPKKIIRGEFNGYDVWGLQYEEAQTREKAWQITLYPEDHSYWVSGKEFYAVSIHSFYNLTNATMVEAHGTITGLEPKEKQAVLTAIHEWENPKDRKETHLD